MSRYDEICHDNRVELPPNSKEGGEDDPIILDELKPEDEAKALQKAFKDKDISKRPWLHESNPFLWAGDADPEDLDDWVE